MLRAVSRLRQCCLAVHCSLAPVLQVKVWLGETQAHYYILSRFLISRMLTVTKIPYMKVGGGALYPARVRLRACDVPVLGVEERGRLRSPGPLLLLPAAGTCTIALAQAL